MVLENDETSLTAMLENYADLIISQQEWYEFVDSFAICLKAELKHCVNMCGSGASRIIKPNFSSVASIYLSALTGVDFMKSGSSANTGVFGSSDFFEKIGVLGYKNKSEIIQKFHWGYCDHYELSPWKKYKKIFKKNDNIRRLIENTVFHDYASEILYLGISDPSYARKLPEYINHNAPRTVKCLYSQQITGYIDEITAGAVFFDGRQVCEALDVECGILTGAEDVFEIDIQLLNGDCEDRFWRESLLRTVAVILWDLGYASDLETGLSTARVAYEKRVAKDHLTAMLGDMVF